MTRNWNSGPFPAGTILVGESHMRVLFVAYARLHGCISWPFCGEDFLLSTVQADSLVYAEFSLTSQWISIWLGGKHQVRYISFGAQPLQNYLSYLPLGQFVRTCSTFPRERGDFFELDLYSGGQLWRGPVVTGASWVVPRRKDIINQ